MNKAIIISAIVDTQCLTLYTDKGDAVVIMQGDPRVPLIVNKLRGVLTGPGTSCEVDLDEGRIDYTPTPVTPQESALKDFAAFEEQSGLIKFFKVAKKAVKRFFNGDEEDQRPVVVERVEPVKLGSMTTYSISDAMDAIESGAAATEAATDESYVLPADAPKGGIDEVMANAKAIPASSAEFTMTSAEEATHDVIATVQLEDGSVGLVPNAHKLATQMAHAAKSGNGKGVEALLKRLAAMPVKRQHSVEDLLKFLERGDLPITDDGRIVFYKLLNKKGGQFGYADCHTGNVNQGVNVEVRMDERLVDHNRNNECSNGLHVARRQYLSGFGGTDCFLGSLAPEDVITVPTYDSNKMRVAAYQLHFHLVEEDRSKVKSNAPFAADSEAAKQLALILTGKQAPITHVVNIGGGQGTQITVTELTVKETVVATTADVEPVAPIAEVDPLQKAPEKAEPIKLTAEKIDPTAVAAAHVEVEHKVVGGGQRDTFKAGYGNTSPRERIDGLLANNALTADIAAQVHAIKRKAKKSYSALGVDAKLEKSILALLPQVK